MRSKLDSSFFAGPCTGGSPWNRLNRWYSDATAHLIEAKRKIFWDLWEEFVEELCDSINRGSPAVVELPRGCEYWKDERVVSAIEGNDNTVHDFDGCMYGLKSKHDAKHNPIKKPWRIVSWGVSFPKLKRKCNRKHEHSECAGRDTKLTQTYTKWIEKIIMRGINGHVMKHSNPSFSRSIKDEVTEILKIQMSQDSESPRSHKSRLSYQVGCARLASNFAYGDLLQVLLVNLLWSPCICQLHPFGFVDGYHSLCDCNLICKTLLYWHYNQQQHHFGFCDGLNSLRDSPSNFLFDMAAAASSSAAGPNPNASETTGVFGGQRSIFGKVNVKLGLAVLKAHADQPHTWTPPRRYEVPDAMAWRNPVTDELIKAWCSHGVPAIVVFAAHFVALRYEEHEITHIIRLSAWLLSMMTPEEHKMGSKVFWRRG
eukprot:s184_g24.t1